MIATVAPCSRDITSAPNPMLTDEGIWLSKGDRPSGSKRPGLLLDRDGVIVKEIGYLGRREDVVLEPGILALLSWAANHDVPVAVVTNQAGIARGFYDWQGYLGVEEEIALRLAREGFRIDATVACPFHPDFTPGYTERHAYWRKPGPGMLRLASECLDLDLARSWLVGDNVSDIEAAKSAGLGQAVHVLTGYGERHRAAVRTLSSEAFRVFEAADGTEAAKIVAANFGLKLRD